MSLELKHTHLRPPAARTSLSLWGLRGLPGALLWLPVSAVHSASPGEEQWTHRPGIPRGPGGSRPSCQSCPHSVTSATHVAKPTFCGERNSPASQAEFLLPPGLDFVAKLVHIQQDSEFTTPERDARHTPKPRRLRLQR